MIGPEQGREPSGMNLADIYYVLFRHKWKILFFSTAGFLVAVFLYFHTPAQYNSVAKLFIPYVVDTKLPSGADQQIRTSDTGGIINSEVEFIKSRDLAEQVVNTIGAARILGPGNDGGNVQRAVNIIEKCLTIEVPPRSDIVKITFHHTDQDLVQPALGQLVTSYLSKHVAIHRSGGASDEALAQRIDVLRSQLTQTDEELRKAKIKAGVTSLEDTKKANSEQVSRLRQGLFEAEAELAEREAALKEMQKLKPSNPETEESYPSLALDGINEYKNVCARLESFRKREQELLVQFTEENSMVKGIREQITATDKLRKRLEEENPRLASINSAKPRYTTLPVDLSAEAAHVKALRAKTDYLNAQLEKLLAEVNTVNEMEATITELQRKKDLLESQYRYFSSTLEQDRINQALGSGKTSNISVVQAPSAPFRESRKLIKLLATVVAAGVCGGIGLAFLIEFYLDRTVRRPSEIETRLHLPLFLTIPHTGRNGEVRGATTGTSGQLRLRAPDSHDNMRNANEGIARREDVAPWDANHGLRSFYEALRDRLVTYFEVRNLTRKPKLVAVTSCSKGAGVTSTAAGLAATLSEVGDGNVLLVDMNSERGTAHPFYKGKPACDLADALESQKRDGALVHDNLYLVTEGANGDKLPRILPRRFNQLVPKLKASDYDYIIFDMPSVNQISVTPRLAGFMDMVLLVIESEKTDREAVKRATSLLAESKANIGVVLNKTVEHVPKRLREEC